MANAWAETEGHRTKTLQSGNFTVKIHRPVLAESERIRREQQVIAALAQLGKGTRRRA